MINLESWKPAGINKKKKKKKSGTKKKRKKKTKKKKDEGKTTVRRNKKKKSRAQTRRLGHHTRCKYSSKNTMQFMFIRF